MADPAPATLPDPGSQGASGGGSSKGTNPVARYPVESFLIALIVTASIAGALIVPIYASVTPYVGDFPFFYFYPLVYMPAMAVALWVVTLLQKRMKGGAR